MYTLTTCIFCMSVPFPVTHPHDIQTQYTEITAATMETHEASEITEESVPITSPGTSPMPVSPPIQKPPKRQKKSAFLADGLSKYYLPASQKRAKKN